MGLATEEISAIAVDPSDENTIYAGSSSDFSAGTVGGLFKSIDGGAVWDTLIRGITVRDIDIHPNDSQVLYVTAGLNYLTPMGILKTLDGGMSWVQVDTGLHLNPEEGPGVLAIDPLHPDTLYLGTSGVFGGNIYKSINGSHTWQAIGNYILDAAGVTAIAIDPTNTNIIYAGTADIGALLKSTNWGGSWEQLNFPDVGIVHDLLVNPLYPDTVYAGTWRYGFYFSADAGFSWQSASCGLPIPSWILKIDVSETEIYIAGNGGGIYAVYASIQDSIGWSIVGAWSFENGINVVNYSSIGNRILAGTEGIYAFSNITSVVDDQGELPTAYHLEQNYPNPFNCKTIIEYSLKEGAMVKLAVYDLTGRLINILVEKRQKPETYSITYDATSLASGIYLYRLEAGRYTKTKKLIILR